MLERLRQSIAGTLAKILIGLLVVSFALWGIGDVFGQSQDPVVAEVGGQDITASKFRRAFEQSFYQVRLQAREQGQDITIEQARRAGLDRQVLISLISRAVLEQNADIIGLAVSNEELIRQTQSDDTFQGPFGQFDASNFRNILRASNLTEEEYLAELELNLTQKQLTTIFTSQAPVPSSLIKQMAQAQNERRVAEYLILKTSAVKKTKKPTDDELQSFIDNNPFDFTLPEKRRLSLLVLDPKKFTATIKISNKKLREEYKLRLSEFATDEERFIQQLVFTTQAEAKRARAKIKTSASFRALAKKRNFSKEDISLGWLKKGEYFSQAAENAALKLRSGQTSAPIETALGWVLLRVDKIKSAKQKSFAQAKRQLQRTLANAQAQEEIDSLHDLIEDDIAGGEPLNSLAKKYKLQSVQSGLLAQSAALPKSASKIKNLKDRLWAMTRQEVLQAAPTEEGGYYWLGLVEIQPSQVQTLAQAKNKARKLWHKAEALRSLHTRARELSKNAVAGTSLAKLSGRKTQLTPPLARLAKSRLLSAELLEAMFRTPQGGVFYGASKNKNELLVAKVVRIRNVKDDVKARADLEKQLAQELASLSSNELLSQFLANSQKQLGFRVYQQNIDLAFEQSPNQPR